MKLNRIYRTALVHALTLNVVLYVITLLAFLYIRSSVMPVEYRNVVSVHTLIVHLVVNFTETFILSYLICVMNFKLLSIEIRTKMRIVVIVICTFVVGILLSYLFSQILIYLSNYGINRPFIPGNIIRDVLIAFFVMLVSLLIHLSGKQQQIELENKTLIAENMRTRYEALKNQVDPHFLFNSLNTLNTLIKIDADKAQQYVQQLSLVFRYTLQNKEVISLEEELNFTRAYCLLMQIRYGDNLQFIYDIEPRFNNYSIIPLSLQILVENAIKHNVITAKQPLTINIVTNNNGTISVSNPIQLKKEIEPGEGIGLVNLSERYRLMWQQEVVVTRNDSIFRVEIMLNEQ